jgi:pimeloyl-ACP methyl ester carboxylesterase
MGADRLCAIQQPVLVIHSREDRAVPFGHAEWSMQHIPQAELCEAGITGHFFWVDPNYHVICQRMIDFLQE